MKHISLLFGLLLMAIQVHSQTYSPIQTLRGHLGQVQNIRFSPNGKVLASGGQYGKIMLWNSTTGQVIKSISAHTTTINEVTFSTDGKMVASACIDGSVRVWEVSSGRLIGTYYNRVIVGRGASKLVAFVVFTKDSKYILFAGDGGALMRAQLGKDRYGLSYKAEPIHTMNFGTASRPAVRRVTGGTLSQDGQAVVFSVSSEIRIVSVYSGNVLRKFQNGVGLNDVVLGPKNNQISTWSTDGYVTFWDYYSGTKNKRIKAGDVNDYSVAAFNNNGTLMVTGVSGNDANVWNTRTGQRIARLVGHAGKVRLARFSPVENMIATGSYDGTIRIWKVEEPEDEIPDPVIPTPPTPVEEKIVYKEKIVYRDRIDTVFVEKIVEMPVEKIVYRDRIVRDTVFVDKKVEKPVEIEEDSDIDVDETKLKVGESFNLKHIQFEKGKSYLLPASSSELKRIIAIMKKYPRLEVILEGHTDNVGSPNKNMSLSYKRVITVKNYICANGNIAESRVDVKASGESTPISPNNSEANRMKNRRVEMKITKL
jgi:WD40 repeat protein/outer membrane protein OmpA-like peptidoglycan-associated protein